MRKTIESSSRFTFDDRSSDDCSDGGLVYLTVLTVPLLPIEASGSDCVADKPCKIVVLA
jgi:hypothetical protein